jgi:hypothetical protein
LPTLKETAALCGSVSTALRVPSMTSVSDMGSPEDRDLLQGERFHGGPLGFSRGGSPGVRDAEALAQPMRFVRMADTDSSRSTNSWISARPSRCRA